MRPHPRFSVICATVLRPSYASLVAALRRQTYHDFELLARGDPGNEYIARNRAVRQAQGEWCVFLDDDTVPEPHYLLRLSKDIDENPTVVAITGPLRGNMWGRGVELLDRKGWWPGAGLSIRREILLQHPFEETWGLPYVPKGWRSDSDMGFWIEDHYPGRWVYDPKLVLDHPNPMGATFQPDVEHQFLQRWKTRAMERFMNDDPRLTETLLLTMDLTPEEKNAVLAARAALRRKIPNLPYLPGEWVV